MIRWPWSRRSPHDAEQLAESKRALARAKVRERSDEHALQRLQRQSTHAHASLAAALGAEQAVIKQNHLGAAFHAALAQGRNPK